METAIIPEQLLQVLKVMNVDTVACQWKIENNGKSINVVLTWNDLPSRELSAKGTSQGQRKRDWSRSQAPKERQAQHTTTENNPNIYAVKAETVSQTSKVHNEKHTSAPETNPMFNAIKEYIASQTSKVVQTSKVITADKCSQISASTQNQEAQTERNNIEDNENLTVLIKKLIQEENGLEKQRPCARWHGLIPRHIKELADEDDPNYEDYSSLEEVFETIMLYHDLV